LISARCTDVREVAKAAEAVSAARRPRAADDEVYRDEVAADGAVGTPCRLTQR
jgi:hypothetical protein